MEKKKEEKDKRQVFIILYWSFVRDIFKEFFCFGFNFVGIELLECVYFLLSLFEFIGKFVID